MENPLLNNLKINAKWLFSGIFLLILGYVLLLIGHEGKSYVQTTFAMHKILLSPFALVAGYFCLGMSILKPGK
jgi:hypothetical protein